MLYTLFTFNPETQSYENTFRVFNNPTQCFQVAAELLGVCRLLEYSAKPTGK